MTENSRNYEMRVKRLEDTIALRKPDRVPVFPQTGLLCAHYAGMTCEQAFNDLDGWLAANEKTVVDLDVDLYWVPDGSVAVAGATHEILDTQQIKWPGHGVGPNLSFQFVEGEYMKAEEYDEFLADPSDWAVRKYMPRIFGVAKGLGMLPPLSTMLSGAYSAGTLGVLTIPPVAATLSALGQAAQEAARWNMGYVRYQKRMKSLGYPAISTSVSHAPYDVISDFLRGMRGTMMDMYLRPDKLLAAQEKVIPMLVDNAIHLAKMSGNLRVVMPLHRGSDGFMSIEQFERFYWPGLKTVILALIDAGLTPCPFWEGTYDQRLEYLKELPPGKVLSMFDRSDLVKVKQELGDIMCIAGGMPVTLLQAATPEEIREETKKVIDTIGHDGGFAMASSTVLDEADPDLVRVWIEATKEYGVY